jgi:hypothetical protein
MPFMKPMMATTAIMISSYNLIFGSGLALETYIDLKYE